MMIISLDNLAKRYSLLPSEALGRASTFDLYVLDVSAKWVQHQQDIEQGKTPKGRIPGQDELMRMLKQARGEL
jgi:hypothetical protein